MKIHDSVRAKAKSIQIMNAELELELNRVLDKYHCKQYEKMFLSGNDRTIHAWKANHDEVPRLIGDSVLLKLKIQDVASRFNMTGNIDIDNGYSFTYQVTVHFPSYF